MGDQGETEGAHQAGHLYSVSFAHEPSTSQASQNSTSVRREIPHQWISKRAVMLPYRRYDMDLRDERELALQRLRVLCHSGLFSILDFRQATALSQHETALRQRLGSPTNVVFHPQAQPSQYICGT